MAISGKLGTIYRGQTEIASVKKWTFAASAEVPKFHTNTSGGVKEAVCGPVDSKGTVEIIVDLNEDGSGGGPPWGPGETVTLSLIPNKNSLQSAFITTQAIISTAPLEADIDGGGPQTMVYAFEGTGNWAPDGGYSNYVPGGN